MPNPGFSKRQVAAAAIRRAIAAKGGQVAPQVETEDALHMRMAGHLHALFPGANPRTVIPRRTRKAHGHAAPPILEPPHAWAMWWHTPNQGERARALGGKFHGMGMRPGFADFAFAFSLPAWPLAMRQGFDSPVKVAQLAVIEAKRPPGVGQAAGGLSFEQERFRDDCQALGVWWGVARSVGQLDALLRGWLDPWGVTLPRVPVLEV